MTSRKAADIARRDHPDQATIFHDRQTANFSREQKLGGCLERGGRRYGDGLLGHRCLNFGPVEIAGMLPGIPIRDDANQLSVTDNRKSTKTAPLHLQPRLDQQILCGHRNRIFTHTLTNKHGNLRSKSTFNVDGFSLSLFLTRSQCMCQKPAARGKCRGLRLSGSKLHVTNPNCSPR
jgi:hypothetical protein